MILLQLPPGVERSAFQYLLFLCEARAFSLAHHIIAATKLVVVSLQTT